jgi:hypothetical protein
MTQLLEHRPRAKEIEIHVRSEDVAGPGDQAHVHFWNDQGVAFDRKVDFERVIGNAAGPKDDYWVARIPTSTMPAGVDVKSLRAKSWLAVQGQSPLWEEAEHKVHRLRVNAQTKLEGNQSPVRRVVEGELAQGKVRLQLDQRQNINGYPDMGGTYVGLSGLRFEPKAGEFAGSRTLLAMVVPHTRLLDREVSQSSLNYSWSNKSERNLRDLDARNLLTLRRQADGSFAAEAAAGKAFTSQYDYRPYGAWGDDTESLGYELIIIDPAKKPVPPPSQQGEFVSTATTP